MLSFNHILNNKCELIHEAIQSAYLAHSISSGVIFFISQKVASLLVSNCPRSKLTWLPSKAIGGIEKACPKLDQKIRWLAPMSAILITSLAAYKLYAMSTSCFTQGLIYGIHYTALRIFAYSSGRDSDYQHISLNKNLNSLFFESRLERLWAVDRLAIQRNTDIIATVTFLVSSISLTILSQNPILANTVACALSIVAKTLFTQIFLNNCRHKVPSYSNF